MNRPVNEGIFEKHGATFHWDEGCKTWCLSGVDKGLYWETDDYEAKDEAQAREDAVEYLLAVNEAEQRD